MVKMKRWHICSCIAPLQRVVVGLLLGYNSSEATKHVRLMVSAADKPAEADLL